MINARIGRQFSNKLCSLIVLTSCMAISQSVYAQTVSGMAFRDYNANGIQDSREPGIGGIDVVASDSNGMPVGSATTLADGSYSAALSVGAGSAVRVEFQNAPSFLQPGPAGNDSGTTVIFAQSGDTGINVGFNNPAQFCQQAQALGDLELVTNCYIAGAQAGSIAEVLVGYDYLGGDTGPAGDVDLPNKAILATAQDMGPTWGLAYQSGSNSIFSAAFMKRHVAFQQDGGTGIIFITDRSTNTTTPFVDLNVLFGSNVTGADPHPSGTNLDRDNNNNGANGDVNEAWDAVGKRAFGDIEISDDQTTLYAVNLFDRSLYRIPLGGDITNPVAPANAAAVTVTPIPNDCPNSDDGRPFALGVRDGVVYVGGVCSAESSQNTNDLSAYIYTFSGGAFSATPILSFPIDHGRGCAVASGCAPADWNPWNPAFTAMPTAFGGEFIYPQPMLTDIEFDNNDLVLGFRDRFGDQMGFRQNSTDPLNNTLFTGDSAGSTLRACDVGGTLVLESNGSCGSLTGGGVGNGRGPGGGQFYVIDFPDHDQVALAGLAQAPGFPDLAFSMYDPIFDSSEFFDGGAGWNSNNNGDGTRRFRIYSSNDTDPLTFGKGGGLGDVELLCNAAPIEIGNRVWNDLNGNSQQDAGEPGITGVNVTLSCAGSVVGTTATDALGQYVFNANNVTGGVPSNANCEVSIASNDPALIALIPVAPNAGSNSAIDSDGVINGGNIIATVNTGPAGANDHRFDFGFRPLSGSVGDQVWCDGLLGAGNGTFDIGEGRNNIAVSIFTDSNCDGTADTGPALATVDTAGDGDYLFTNLPVGTVGAPVCYVTQVNSADPDLGLCNLPQTPASFAAQLSDVNPDDLTHDYYFAEPVGSIGDQVWCDGLIGTGNGSFDLGEGLNNIAVNLFTDANCDGSADSGTPISSANTSGDGGYLFSLLPIGSVGNPVCYVTQVDSADPDLGSCNLLQTPPTVAAQLSTATPDDLSHDYYFAEPAGRIGDQVWCDGMVGTGNGIFDAGEGLNNIAVNLFTDANCDGSADSGTPINSANTSGDGGYLFDNLSVGTVATPICYVTAVDANDADLGACNNLQTPPTVAAQLSTASPEDLTHDYYFVEPAGRIGDQVWCDGVAGSGNGIFDAGEGLNNIAVNLFTDANCDGTADNGTPINSADTSGDGGYLFNNLPVGSNANPVCYVTQVDANDADLGVCNSLQTPPTVAAQLSTGTPEDLTHDYYFVEPLGSVGDQVWCESSTNLNTSYDPADGDFGLSNIQVSLFNGNNCASNPSAGSLVGQMDTDGNGEYLFTDLAVGAPGSSDVCYVVQVDETDVDLGSCNIQLTPIETVATLTTTEPNDLDNDFGFQQSLSLGNFVWYDHDENGIQDPGEAVVADVVVQLFDNVDCTAPAIATTITDADGLYLFDNLSAGDYCLDFTPPPGWVFSDPIQGNDGEQDSNADPAGQITNINLTETDLSFDVGLFAPIGTIAGVMFCDADPQNGVLDTGEERANVTFNLDRDLDCDGFGDVFLDSQETAADGSYSFTGLTVALAPAPPNPQVCYVVSPDLDDPDLLGCNIPMNGGNIMVPPTTDDPETIGLTTTVVFLVNAIPTLDRNGLALMMLMFLAAAGWVFKRRQLLAKR